MLVYFLSQINYVVCHSNLFYQVLGRLNNPENMGLASLMGGVAGTSGGPAVWGGVGRVHREYNPAF